MRAMSERRRLVEQEGRIHAVRRGRRGALHFENMPRLHKTLEFLLRLTLTKDRGVRNALDVRAEEVGIVFGNLPAGFDNTRILLVTDLHIDGMDWLAEKIISVADVVDYDFCILGGDYSFGSAREGGLAYSRMREVAARLRAKSRVFAILGNHDRYSIGELLEGCGVEVLVNESVCFEKDGDKIYLSGLDDCHYYGADDIELADGGIDAGAFKILVCHSPEAYRQAAEAVPRRLLKGEWRYDGMCGYTSRGAGASGVAVRYFCPPEMTVITLART